MSSAAVLAAGRGGRLVSAVREMEIRSLLALVLRRVSERDDRSGEDCCLFGALKEPFLSLF